VRRQITNLIAVTRAPRLFKYNANTGPLVSFARNGIAAHMPWGKRSTVLANLSQS
jgi:hypothetical protein